MDPEQVWDILAQQLPWMRKEFPEVGEIVPVGVSDPADDDEQILVSVEDSANGFAQHIWMPRDFALKLHPAHRDENPETLDYLRIIFRAEFN